MAEKFTEFNPAALLETDDDIAIFMADAFEAGNVKYIAKANGIVARARSVNEMACKTGISREQLYRSLSERGNSTLK
ncbi:addiction module antidote protein [Halomonas sp. AOP27-A1-41]|uniref:addiction module antidote protein n=1 Tax=Halomonas sp. AOP27-A1-41 TaxID=3457707 RepID=UPI004034A8CE